MRDFFRPGRSPVSGLDFAAASSHPLATAAAITTMARGGNAIDAAVTATAVLCVVEPQSTGIGGDCFALISRDGAAPAIGYNGSGRTPCALPIDGIGDPGIGRLEETSVHAVTVPGLVDALARLLADHGTISLAEAFGPAIRYAAEGFIVHQKVAAEWATVQAKLAGTEDARTVCLLEGRVPRPGEVIRFPALAATLARIAEAGPKAFYSGAIAKAMVACLRRHGGHHAVDDFSRHQGSYVEAVGLRYRDVDVWQFRRMDRA
jgi:gamma-glutamyltranspeptidase/glutathione hydrolase